MGMSAILLRTARSKRKRRREERKAA